MFINTLQKTLIICLYSFHSIALSAQSDNNNTDQNIELKPAITEKDIASYFPEKYPTKRWENKAVSPDFYNTPYDISLFSAKNGEDSARLWSQTKSMFAYGFGVIGIIALLPEDVSNWDKEQGLFSKWSDNVKEGPVWDRDNGPLNLIGHPYFGGVYYQAARKSGYRQWDAFIYSTLMSSFYWEYGIEAFAEVPSIQDLVITPVLGWVYGEWAFTTEMKIRQNNDEIFGSSFLGSSALIFLDPVDSLSVGINQLFGKEIIKAGTSYVSVKEVPIDNGGNTENQYQLNVNFQLGDGRNYPSTKSHPPRSIKDPVDTGIIGVSYGVGDLSLDKNWQLSDEEKEILYFNWVKTTIKNVNEVQALGSSITYGRRYALSSMCGIASDEDIDGTGDTQKTPIEKKAKEIFNEPFAILKVINRRAYVFKGSEAEIISLNEIH